MGERGDRRKGDGRIVEFETTRVTAERGAARKQRGIQSSDGMIGREAGGG